MKKSVPSLRTLAAARMIPIEFFKKCDFKQGDQAIEMHFKNPDGSPARTQNRNYELERPKKWGFTWEKDDSKKIVPYGYSTLILKPSTELLYLGEGATDGVTANWLGLEYIGFQSATTIPVEILTELVQKAIAVRILKEADDAGKKFAAHIRLILKSIGYQGNVTVVEFKEDAKDLSDLFVSHKGDKAATLQAIEQLSNTIILFKASSDEESEPDDTISIQIGNKSECTLNEEECRLELRGGTPITNFYLKVVGQRVTTMGEEKKREYEMLFIRKTESGIESIPFVVTSEEYNDGKKLFKATELYVGTRAKTYHSQASFALKAMASAISDDVETDYTTVGGYQKDGSYVLGDCIITADSITFGKKTIDLNGNKKAEIFNFVKIPKEDAVNLFAQVIVLYFKAYGSTPAAILTVFPILAVLLNIRPDFVQQIHAGLEITGDQSSGKTELHKFLMSYFCSKFTDSDFVRANDTVAALQASVGSFNGASPAINDIKSQSGEMSIEKFAELIQNIIDAAPYTKIGENKKPVTQIPFVGLATWNGQQSLAGVLSSLATRTIVITPTHGDSSVAFNELLSLSSSFSGITPHLIQLCLNPEFQKRLRLNYERHLLDLRKSIKVQFNVERTLKIFALTAASADLIFETIRSSSSNDVVAIDEIMQLHNKAIEAIYSCCNDQIGRVSDIDIVLKTFLILVQGLQSGHLFLGEQKPEQAASTATCIGEMPNLATQKIWINPGPALEFVKKQKSANELAHIQQSIFTRELVSRGIISKKGARATSRMKLGGEWGWLVDYHQIPVLAEYLTNQSGDAIVTPVQENNGAHEAVDVPF